jgi:hypothetical protein
MRHYKVFDHIEMRDFAFAIIVLVSLMLLRSYLPHCLAGTVPWHHCPHPAGVVAPPANALGLSIKVKDLLFCTGIGRWPLLLSFYLCKWPLNGRVGTPFDGTSIHSPQQQAHHQDPRGCVGSKSSSHVLTELGNVGLLAYLGRRVGEIECEVLCIVCHSS